MLVEEAETNMSDVALVRPAELSCLTCLTTFLCGCNSWLEIMLVSVAGTLIVGKVGGV